MESGLAALGLAMVATASATPAEDLHPYVTPYVAARQQLIDGGFDPVPVFGRPGGATCKTYRAPCHPELMACRLNVGGRLCDWLYRRRADGAYFVVAAFSGRAGQRPRGWTYRGMDPLEDSWERRLDGYTIATSDGRGRQYFCVRRKERVTPICSPTSGTPCWVKPPAGWHPAHEWCE